MPRIYPAGNGHGNIGDVRWEVEWIRVKSSATDKTEIDPDFDTVTHVEYERTEEQAVALANDIFQRETTEPNKLCWGVVTVQKQVVDWFIEEDNLAEWVNVGDSIEIS